MRNSLFPARPGCVAATLTICTACAAMLMNNAAFATADNPDAGADGSVVSVQTVHVQRATIAQPVRGYGIVAASASNLTTVNLPYLARVVQMRVQAGQRVTRGAPLVVVQADPAAVLAAAQAGSAATLAQGELTRTQSLYDKGLATASQLAAATKALDDAREALAAQRRQGVTRGDATVVAPLDGVVLQVSVAQGDQVQPGAALLQLAGGSGRDAHANVMLGVEPSDAAAIHPGDVVTLHGLSVALEKDAANGRVVLVGASVDQQSQLVDIGANVPPGQTALMPGTRVAADIASRSGMHWIVPRAAVLKDDRGAYVFQITPQHKARRVPVIAQIENGDRYGVDGAIDGAQGVVVSGNYELKDGMAVRTDEGAPR